MCILTYCLLVVFTENTGHSAVGIGLGVFFGLLIFFGVAAVAAVTVLYIIWRKRRRLSQNNAHQLLTNIDESNEETGNDGSVVKEEGLQAQKNVQPPTSVK